MSPTLVWNCSTRSVCCHVSAWRHGGERDRPVGGGTTLGLCNASKSSGSLSMPPKGLRARGAVHVPERWSGIEQTAPPKPWIGSTIESAPSWCGAKRRRRSI